MRSLSGGERNRLLLARLFARPANVLVLDEPTNDLDIDTLELLEDLLQDYDGTVFLVSHDRTFLDNVVTSTIAYEGEGLWREYEGGVQDWLIQSHRAREMQQAAAQSSAAPAASNEKTRASVEPQKLEAPRAKLSFKEKRELESLPQLIESLEAEQAKARAELADGSLYTRDGARAALLQGRDGAIDAELMTALERWEVLSARG